MLERKFPAAINKSVTLNLPVVREFLTSEQGLNLVAGFSERREWLNKYPKELPAPGKDWSNNSPLSLLDTIPAPLVKGFDKVLIRKADMKPEEYAAAYQQGFEVLGLFVNMAIHGEELPAKDAPEKMLALAFGADKLTRSLRDQLVKPFGPDFNPPKGFDLPDLSLYLNAGNFRDHLRTLIVCGRQANLLLMASTQPVGSITKISSRALCSGDTVMISFDKLGANPPPADIDLYLAVPMTGGTMVALNLRQAAPQLFANWPGGAGELEVKLPVGISSGCLQFYAVPKVDGCTGQGLTAAAMALWQASLLAGSSNMESLAQFAINSAALFESFKPPQPAACGASMPNYITAGLPNILEFGLREDPDVRGRPISTLYWKVENATSISISPHPVPGSETQHQLRPVPPLPNDAEGEVRVTHNGTTNWWGEYVLTAESACGRVEKPLLLFCSKRNFTVGTARVPLNFTIPNDPANIGTDGLPMQGFSSERQRARGLGDPISVRAFVMIDAAGNRCAIAVADIWSCSQFVKNTVVDRLVMDPNVVGLTAENVMLCGTHTHSAPGGYFHNYLYNVAGGGFYPGVAETIISAYVRAITQAAMFAKPGRIFIGTTDVPEGGENRSRNSFVLNAEAMADPTISDTDDGMTVLKFVEDTGAPWRTAHGTFVRYAAGNPVVSPKRDLGVLTWHAMHPTNLGMNNHLISGDNKGWAAILFERSINPLGNGAFVAGFANSNCGDVSGNVRRNAQGGIVRTGGVTVFDKPLGGPNTSALLQKNFDAMRANGARQFKAAKAVFDRPDLVELGGTIDFRYNHVNMSNVTLTSGPFAGMRTWPAAMGVSFGAGSTEDGDAVIFLGDAVIDSGIEEGISRPSFDNAAPLAIVRMLVALGGTVATVVAALVGGLVYSAGLAALLANPTTRTAIITSLIRAIQGTPDKNERGYIMSILGYIAIVFAKLVSENIPRFANPASTFNIAMPTTVSLPAADLSGHFPKPIMYAAGYATTDAFSGPIEPCPMVPNVVPIQLLRIGRLAVAGVPAEITTMAGRRLNDSISGALAGVAQVDAVALCTYSNSYSGYISTFEEYQGQEYEGASTLYGPHTLGAYQQLYTGLAAAMSAGTPVVIGAPETVPGVFVAPGAI